MITPVTQLANFLFVLFAIGSLSWLVLRFARRSTSPTLLSRLSWVNRTLALATAFVAGLVGNYPPSFEEYLGGCLFAAPVAVAIAVWIWLRRTGRIGGRPSAAGEVPASREPVSCNAGSGAQAIEGRPSILLMIALPLTYLVAGFLLFVFSWDEWTPIDEFKGRSFLAAPLLLVNVVVAAIPAIPILMFRRRLLAHRYHRVAVAVGAAFVVLILGYEVRGRYTTVVYWPSADYHAAMLDAFHDQLARLPDNSPAQACALSREQAAFYRGKENSSNYLFRFGGGEFPVNVSQEDFIAARADLDCTMVLRIEAENGNARAQYHLGRSYEHGLGVPRDDRKAAGWYLKAAEQEDPDAEYNLGRSYEQGQGVPRNAVRAALWYRRAADHGEPQAQMNLAIMHEIGRGVPRDDAEAVVLWERAAMQGVAEAQFQMGVIYDVGRNGVLRDHYTAFDWYQKAAGQGHAEAQRRLERMIRERAERPGCSGCAAPES